MAYKLKDLKTEDSLSKKKDFLNFKDMLVIQQLIILVLMLVCIIGSTYFLFWIFFRKDIPEYDKVEKSILP